MKPARDTFPNIFDACFLVFVLFLVEWVLISILQVVHRTTSADWAFVVIVSHGLLFSVLLHMQGLRFGELLHPSSRSATATMASLSVPIMLVAPGFLMLSLFVQTVLQTVLPLSDSERRYFEVFQASNLGTVLVVCLIGPTMEELLFRGIILRSFLNQYDRRLAIVASALIFGAAHLNIYQFVGASFIGLLLGWIYERTQSVWPCILLHVCNNALITLLPQFDGDGDAGGDVLPSLTTMVVMLVIGFVGWRALRNRLAALPDS